MRDLPISFLRNRPRPNHMVATSLNYLPKVRSNRCCSKLNMDSQDRSKYNLLQETISVLVVTSESRGGLDRFRTSRAAHKSFWECKQAQGQKSDKISKPRIRDSKAFSYQSVMEALRSNKLCLR